MPKNIKLLAKEIKLIASDIDGVLTAGEIIILHSGEEIKIWDVRDRYAFSAAKKADSGIKFAWITGRKSKQVQLRAKEIGIDFLYQECMNKKEALIEICSKLKILPTNVLYIGDDIVDLPALRFAGIAVAPADAFAEVKKQADIVTKKAGGKGVLREVVDIVLRAQGLWHKANAEYL